MALLRSAWAAPMALVDDGFDAADDSLWHFQTAAFTDGVLSPGLEADPRGRTSAGGQLRIDPALSALRFEPRRGAKAHRSCFLGYRSDFRMEDVYASKVAVEVKGSLTNPASGDSVGGLFVLVRYENEVGNASLARTVADIRSPRTILLDTAALAPVVKTDWFSAPPLDGERLARARSRIIGVGLCYISRNGPFSGPQTVLVGGFKATGELSWPRLPGSPEEAEVMAGDTVALAWKFPPALDAEFHWFRNGKPVPSAQGPRFVFRTGDDDARIHDFTAEARLPNGDRIATERIRITVSRPAPPVVTSRQSGDTAVPVGGTAVFRVAASGLRPLAYQWYRNGKPIPGAAGATYTFVTTGIPEGGSYQCEVKDKQGRTTRSRPVTLIVKPGPEEEADFPQGLSVGAKVGINVSDFYRDPAGAAPSEQQLHFLQAGLGAVWQLRPAWALQADLLFSRKGVIYDFPDHTSAYNLDYLELPLLVRARLGRWMPKAPLCLLLGGYGAALVAAAREDDWDAFKGSGTLDDLGTFDYGAVAGMSWQFGMVSAEWRYALGLAPLDAGRIGNGKLNGVFSFMVGVALFTAQEGER